MRVAVIVFSQKKKAGAGGNFPSWASSLAEGMESMGHRADLMDGGGDMRSLPGYDYLVLASWPLSFLSGKIPPEIRTALSSAGSLGRKKGAAFIKKTGLFSSRALSRLMALMEKEGIIVNWSDFILSPAQAGALGKRIGA